MEYLGNTFSPMMLKEGEWAEVVEIDLTDLPRMEEATSVISHEITASILSVLLGEEVSFNRTGLSLVEGDTLFCVIPNFRSSEAREFTKEEVETAGYRCFQIQVSPSPDQWEEF